MDDEPHEQISELEVQIEELADALERCRKTALASKAAMGLGGILMAATTLGFVTFDPVVMIAGLAALLGGVVVFGSHTSTANQLSESMRSAEAQRTALIGRLDIRLVKTLPQIGIPDGIKDEFASATSSGHGGRAARDRRQSARRGPGLPEPDWQAPHSPPFTRMAPAGGAIPPHICRSLRTSAIPAPQLRCLPPQPGSCSSSAQLSTQQVRPL
jgi:hypothetical protein